MDTIDNYIASCEPAVAKRLQAIRELMKKAAPNAQEAIKYKIPTLVQKKNLIHFAAFTNHIGIYPATSKDPELIKAMEPYLHGAGTIQIKHSDPLPAQLITNLVLDRVKSIEEGLD